MDLHPHFIIYLLIIVGHLESWQAHGTGYLHSNRNIGYLVPFPDTDYLFAFLRC